MRAKGQLPAATPEPGVCLARSVVKALGEDPTLEAVTIDRENRRVTIATLGQTDVVRLSDRITRTLEAAEVGREERRCGLLEGRGECRTCKAPLPEEARRRILIEHEGGQTTIARVTCPTAPKFWRWREIPWPKLVAREFEFLEPDEHLDEWKPQLALALVCGALGLIGYFSPAAVPSMRLAAYLLAYVAGSWFTVLEVWERLQKRVIDVHFLMLAVAAGSAAIGAWGEGAMLLFLFSFSSALEHYALGRTQREIKSLFREAPKTAAVLDDHGHEMLTPVEKLRRGMRLLIKPGEQFPVDGEISKGQTATDESNLTGEATPVDKQVGDSVLAGTMNTWGAVEVTVSRPVAESSLQRIIKLIQEAQHQKAPVQQITDRFSGYYTYLVLGLSLGMFLVWWLGMGLAPFGEGGPGHSAFYRAMSLLVVASPCALVLSIPSAVLAAIAWSARNGILFRGGAAVEKLASITTVALDKTGTLTNGELRVETVESFPAGREAEVVRLAYSLERLSSHPLARAITRHGKHQGFQAVPVEGFESLTGHGLAARYQGQACYLGRREWVAAQTGRALPAGAESGAGASEIWLSCGTLLGRIGLRDDIRPQARRVLDALRLEGLRTLVLTGDRKHAAESLRSALAVEDVRAELSPDQKLSTIQGLAGQGQRVAMIGDGVNDAPSLASAYIGVAMGARGADAALEQSDVVLMHDRLENFLAAFRLSQRARRIIRQNLFVSLGTVVVLVSFALAGKMPLTIGVIGHEGSTVVVVMNSLRLLFGRKD